jgi:hypothetical protein
MAIAVTARSSDSPARALVTIVVEAVGWLAARQTRSAWAALPPLTNSRPTLARRRKEAAVVAAHPPWCANRRRSDDRHARQPRHSAIGIDPGDEKRPAPRAAPRSRSTKLFVKPAYRQRPAQSHIGGQIISPCRKGTRVRLGRAAPMAPI